MASGKLYDREQILVNYENGTVKRVVVSSESLAFVRLHSGDDALLDLFDQPESEVVRLLGPPNRQVSSSKDILGWRFSTPGVSAEQSSDVPSRQGLTLYFGADMRCTLMILEW
jgi:hypothetical protein